MVEKEVLSRFGVDFERRIDRQSDQTMFVTRQGGYSILTLDRIPREEVESNKSGDSIKHPDRHAGPKERRILTVKDVDMVP